MHGVVTALSLSVFASLCLPLCMPSPPKCCGVDCALLAPRTPLPRAQVLFVDPAVCIPHFALLALACGGCALLTSVCDNENHSFLGYM